MSHELGYGMDHPYWDWSPIVRRAPLAWPNGARLAVCLLVDLGHYEWQPPPGAFDPPTHTPPHSLNPYPDYVTVTFREYGHRIGIFRVMDALDAHAVKATVPMDAYTAAHYPSLVDECERRGWEIIAHGLTQRQAITSLMSEAEERRYIGASIDGLERALGRRPAGWLGPEHSQSARTPAILAEMGIRYCCDFPNDEQPYRIHTPRGELYALPCMIELGDVMGHYNRKLPLRRWVAMVQEAFDVMYEDAASSGLLLALRLHPWCIGQPYRIKHLDALIGHMVRRQGVWLATGSEIIDWYRGQPHAGFERRA
ncbi:MAG: polysaccharide deacetylase family protein [Burkholderiales bacterium]|nr:polysaccharide deacetylase family protein [Burkholderiales bacterium]